jgi:trk system potassium uptake protein
MRASSHSPWFQRVKKRFLGLSPPQALVLSYIGLSILGTLLLKLPGISHQPTSWLQALFTAVSASTVTGLVVVDTGKSNGARSG